VSEGSATGIDPRFDPRFQRGYVPDAAGAPQVTDAAAAAAPVGVEPVRDHDDGPAEVLQALLRASGEARGLGSSAPADANASTGRASTERTSTGRASTGPTASPATTDHEVADADAVVASDGRFPEEDVLAEEEHLSPTRWMWIALGACFAFVVVGAVAFWVQASDPSNYIGGVRAGIDETFRLVINALAPALVQAGVIGIVVVLVTWAVRGRASRTPEDRP
jgi:hypothetical protein